LGSNFSPVLKEMQRQKRKERQKERKEQIEKNGQEKYIG
jgi:hypothetical protein